MYWSGLWTLTVISHPLANHLINSVSECRYRIKINQFLLIKIKISISIYDTYIGYPIAGFLSELVGLSLTSQLRILLLWFFHCLLNYFPHFFVSIVDAA